MPRRHRGKSVIKKKPLPAFPNEKASPALSKEEEEERS